MNNRERIKLVGTIVVMMAALAVSAARTGINAANPGDGGSVTYEVTAECTDV